MLERGTLSPGIPRSRTIMVHVGKLGYNIGAFIIRIGLWGILYYNKKKEVKV